MKPKNNPNAGSRRKRVNYNRPKFTFKNGPERCTLVMTMEDNIEHILKHPETNKTTKILVNVQLEAYEHRYESTMSPQQKEIIRLIREAIEKKNNKQLREMLERHTCDLKGEHVYEQE